MREGFLIKQNQDQAKNILTIYNQLKFIDSRMQAFEAVLENRWDMLKAIWNPKGFKKAVDEMQIYIMHKHDQKVNEAVQKAQAEAQKPKLSIISPNGFKGVGMVVLFAFALFPGCVSTKFHKKEMERSRSEGYASANLECLTLQKKIQNYINSLNERLKKFNQLDSAGNLVPLKPKFKGDVDKPVTGTEEWMK